MEDSNKKNISGTNFLRGILIFSFPTFMGALISMISIPIVTRVFSPEELGVLNLFIVYNNIIIQVGLMGLEQAYVRFFYEPPLKIERKLLGGICLIGSVLASSITLFFVIIFLRKSQSAVFYTNPYIIGCLVICVLCGVVTTYTRLTSRMKYDYVKFSIQSILFTFASKMSYVIVAIFSPTYFAAIIVLTASYLFIAVTFLPMLWHANFIIVKNFKKEPIWELIQFGLPLMPVGLLTVLNNSVSQLMLERYISYEAIGIYSCALSVTSVISLVQAGFNTYWAPFVWENYKTEQKRITRIHHLVTFIMISAGLGIILLDDIIYLILGDQFQSSKIFFPILLIVPIVYTISETTGLGIGIEKKTFLSTLITIVVIISNIILCYVLLPRIGIIGAAISSAIAAILRLMLLSVIGERYYKCVDKFNKMILALSLYCIAIIIAVIFIKQLIIKVVLLLFLLSILCFIYCNEIKYILVFIISTIEKSRIRR